MASVRVLSDQEIQQREAAAQAAGELALGLDLARSQIGLFSYGDGPPAAGGGSGGFLWFGDEQEAMQFVRNHIVFFCPGPSSANVSEVQSKVESIIDSGGHDDVLRESLNVAMRGFSQIRWWGSFSDLCEGAGEFQCEVRGWFRKSDGREGDGPIDQSEREAFADSIWDYGI
jgi:hypothetical protein